MITITDVFKNNISSDKTVNNTLPFIIISTSNTKQVLIKISENIYKLNYQMVHNMLKENNVNPSSFAPLGDLYYDSVPDTINILLVNINNNTSEKPFNYIKI